MSRLAVSSSLGQPLCEKACQLLCLIEGTDHGGNGILTCQFADNRTFLINRDANDMVPRLIENAG